MVSGPVRKAVLAPSATSLTAPDPHEPMAACSREVSGGVVSCAAANVRPDGAARAALTVLQIVAGTDGSVSMRASPVTPVATVVPAVAVEVGAGVGVAEVVAEAAPTGFHESVPARYLRAV